MRARSPVLSDGGGRRERSPFTVRRFAFGVMEHTRLACKSFEPEALELGRAKLLLSRPPNFRDELRCSPRAQIVEFTRGTRMLPYAEP